jgi:hypothetical protein
MFFVPFAFAADLTTTLSSHDFASCASLGEPTSALYDGLVSATAVNTQPSTVPIRAASCLLELFGSRAELATVIGPWMSDPERQGLALVVIGKIDELPSPLAVTLATSALQNPDARALSRFKSRLSASVRPEILAVVGPE